MKIIFIVITGLIAYATALSFGATAWQALGIQTVIGMSLIMLVEDD